MVAGWGLISDIVLETLVSDFLFRPNVLFFSDIKDVLGFMPDVCFSDDERDPPTLFLLWPIFEGAYILDVDVRFFVTLF